MRIVVVALLTLMVCPFAQWFGSVAPVETPAIPVAHVEISADPGIPQPGDTFTITGIPVNIGLPHYTLTLSSGATATVTYGDEVISEVGDGFLSRDEQFEIVSAQAEMNRVEFLIRALKSGTAQAVISATGEVRTPEGAYMWSGGTSPTLTLMVVR